MKIKTSLKIDKQVLYDYLRGGLSTRELCKKYSEIEDKTGFKSHYILKKYGLNTEDKGSLFFFSSREVRKIINKIIINDQKKSFRKMIPNKLKCYKNITAHAENEDKIYIILLMIFLTSRLEKKKRLPLSSVFKPYFFKI